MCFRKRGGDADDVIGYVPFAEAFAAQEAHVSDQLLGADVRDHLGRKLAREEVHDSVSLPDGLRGTAELSEPPYIYVHGGSQQDLR